MIFFTQRRLALLISIVFLFILNSCKKNETPLDSSKDITEYTLKYNGENAIDTNKIYINISTDSIKIAVPYNADLSRFTPYIQIKGKSIKPESGTAQDFTNPIVYTLTADDGSTKKYVVMVTKGLSPEKEITSFQLRYSNDSEIDPTVSAKIIENTIQIEVPFYINLKDLKPSIEIKGKSISPENKQITDFSSPVVYTVKAEDGTERNYTVLVKQAGFKNVVYVGGYNKTFYALNATNGDVIWKHVASTKGFTYSDPVYSDGIVYSGNSDGTFYAFDAITGEVLWTYKTSDKGIESSATVAGGLVYFGSNDFNLYALNAKTGALAWKFATHRNLSSSPVVSNGVIYFGSPDGNVFSLGASNGSINWIYSLGDMVNQSSPVMLDGAVVIGSRNGYLYSIDINQVNLKWKVNPGNVSLELSSPIYYGGLVYVAGWFNSDTKKAGGLYAINKDTGKIEWTALENTGFSSDIFAANNIVYAPGDNGKFSAVNAKTGEVIWRKELYSNGSGALIANDMLFIGNGATATFYALNPQNGAEIWKLNMPESSVMSTPCVIDANGKMVHR